MVVQIHVKVRLNEESLYSIISRLCEYVGNHSDESTDGIEKDTNAPYEASVRSSLSIFY